MTGMSTSTMVASVIAAYAAVVSTLSLVLAIRSFRAGSPIVDLDWEYDESLSDFRLHVLNTGRADVTISSLSLVVIHEVIIRQSGKYFDARFDIIDDIPANVWYPRSKESALPFRLASNSLLELRIDGSAINVPDGYPFDELMLRFTARFPGGRQRVFLRGDLLRHFLGIDPDRPIQMPSPGSLPREDD